MQLTAATLIIRLRRFFSRIGFRAGPILILPALFCCHPGAAIITESPDTSVDIPVAQPVKDSLSEFLYELTFVEFQLVNEKEEPIPNEAYVITLPNGKKIEGTLDGNGFVHLDDVPRGRCTIRFPNLKSE